LKETKLIVSLILSHTDFESIVQKKTFVFINLPQITTSELLQTTLLVKEKADG
jgi:hypothetical protein